jgi:hypothetical protein
MQPTVNVPNTDAARFKRFSGRVPTVLPALVICLLVHVGHGTSVAQTPTSKPVTAAAQSDAQKVFEKMKALTGSWQGTIMGMSVNTTIRVASSGTAILHEATTTGGRPPDHEITMFYLDGDRFLATHYCDGGNQARFEGKMSPDGKTIEFTFLDVAGNTQGGVVKRMMFTMIDANHHGVELTFMRPDGKPVELRAEFQRTAPL